MKAWFHVATLSLAAALSAPAQAVIVVYTTALSGAAESPANASAGTGTATVTIDTVAHTLLVGATFSGLSANTTASHIHCCTAVPGVGNVGVATETPTFALFPLGVTSGSFSELYNLTLTSSFNAPFVTANGGTAAGAESALFAGLANGTAYLNIHTTQFPAGEIRGFLAPIPEPSTYALMLAGLAGLALYRRRRG
jgi:CHRD domain/PEP-CTERM motif